MPHLVTEQDAIETNADETGRPSFGTPETNKLVEIAAIKAVAAAYESDGWKVVSHEDRKHGYDMYCTRFDAIPHVEVKGAKGRDCSFIVTGNELDFSYERDSFRLCVVTGALDHKLQKIETFTAKDVASKFDLEPLDFAARLKQ